VKTHRSRGLCSIVAITCVLVACDQMATAPQGSPPELAKAASDPTVTATDPASGPQDSTLNVRVLGSGYDQGSRADFALAGVVDPTKVKTNSTLFVSSKELVANITIAQDATVALYDVIVTTAKGKKGIGTERFFVRAVNDIGTLGGGTSTARGVNGSGTIIGFATNASGLSRPFIWTEVGGMKDLGTLPGFTKGAAHAVSATGVVVGSSGDRAPTRWVPGAAGSWSVQYLGSLGGTYGYAFDVNDQGTIVGYADNSAGSTRAFRWTEATGMVSLALLSGAISSRALGLNADGTIVGTTNVSSGAQVPVVWASDGGVHALQLCPGLAMGDGQDVNDAGVVVGTCFAGGGGPALPVRWDPDPSNPGGWLAPVSLGSLGGSSGRAYGINNAGQVVGISDVNGQKTHAFFWDAARGIRDLGALLPNGLGAAMRIGDPSVGVPQLIVGVSYTSAGKGHAVWWRQP
jgi:probable HAF family extracellular repeat protein